MLLLFSIFPYLCTFLLFEIGMTPSGIRIFAERLFACDIVDGAQLIRDELYILIRCFI